MYSIMAVTKKDSHAELLIGSAIFLGFIFQPAIILKLDTLSSLTEDNDITGIDNLSLFKEEMKKLSVFWRNNNITINNFKPDEDFIGRLEDFSIKINKMPSDNIEYITLF